MKKGFTLIELLSVLVLLGFIFALVFPNLIDKVQEKQKEIDESKLKMIYNGAKNYCINERIIGPYKSSCNVKLKTLYNENRIPFELDDYCSGDDCGDYTCITVKKLEDGKYSYSYSKTNC